MRIVANVYEKREIAYTAGNRIRIVLYGEETVVIANTIETEAASYIVSEEAENPIEKITEDDPIAEEANADTPIKAAKIADDPALDRANQGHTN